MLKLSDIATQAIANFDLTNNVEDKAMTEDVIMNNDKWSFSSFVPAFQ